MTRLSTKVWASARLSPVMRRQSCGSFNRSRLRSGSKSSAGLSSSATPEKCFDSSSKLYHFERPSGLWTSALPPFTCSRTT